MIAIIFYWIIFRKFNMPGWYSLIPFFNWYALFDLAWTTSSFWLYMLCMGCMIGATCSGMVAGMVLCYVIGMLIYSVMLYKLYQQIPDGKIFVILAFVFDVVFNMVSFISSVATLSASGVFGSGGL